MVDLSVNLAGMQMDNPVVPASGTFGFGKEFKDIYDINILGSFLTQLDFKIRVCIMLLSMNYLK